MVTYTLCLTARQETTICDIPSAAIGRLPSVTWKLNERLLTERADVQTEFSKFWPSNDCFTSHSRRSNDLR